MTTGVAGLSHHRLHETTSAAEHGRTVRPGEYRPEGGVALCRLLAVAETHDGHHRPVRRARCPQISVGAGGV